MYTDVLLVSCFELCAVRYMRWNMLEPTQSLACMTSWAYHIHDARSNSKRREKDYCFLLPRIRV